MTTASAYPTIILVVVRPDAIWIEADSLRTDGRDFQTVCKVHEEYGGVLLKWGNVQDTAMAYSTDDDVRLLLSANETFAQFETASPDVLRSRVEENINETIVRWKTTHPEKFVSEDTLREPPTLEQNFGVDMGLVFVTVIDGKPTLYELYVGPTAQPVTNSDGSTGYRWIVEKAVWKKRDSKVEAIYYPSIELGSQDQIRLTSNPNQEMLSYFRDQEAGYPCEEAAPNVFLTVSPAVADPKKHYSLSDRKKLSQTAAIKYLDYGSCPSWEQKPISISNACLASRRRRAYSVIHWP